MEQRRERVVKRWDADDWVTVLLSAGFAVMLAGAGVAMALAVVFGD